LYVLKDFSGTGGQH